MTEVPKIVHDRLRVATPSQSSLDAKPGEASHPDADLLTAFAEQALAQAEREGVLEHLALCGDCREVVALALPTVDVSVSPIAAENDAARSTPIAVKAERKWLSSPRFAWANLRWATVAAAVAVMASALLLRPGQLNQPAVPSVNKQTATVNARASGTQVASSTTTPATITSATADQVTTLAKNEGVGSTPEMRSGVRASKKPDAGPAAAPLQQTETGMLLADNRLRNDQVDKVDRDKNKDEDEKKDSFSSSLHADKPSATAVAGAAMANFPARRGVTETVEVSAAETAVEAAPSLDSTLTARSEAPAIVKTKPALKEMDASTDANIGTNANEAQTTEAAVSTNAAKSQTRDLLRARNMAQLVPLAPNAAWAITGGALQRSVDSGRSWQDVLRPDHPLQCYASHNQNVWAGGLAGLLFHSADGALTWTKVHPSIKSQALVSDITHIEVRGSGEIVLSTSNNEVWSSADGGQAWEKK